MKHRLSAHRVALALLLTAVAFATHWAGNSAGGPPGHSDKPQPRNPSLDAPLNGRTQPRAVPADVITNSIGMRLVRIPPGDFEMGSSDGLVDMEKRSDAARSDDLYTYYVWCLEDERPQHKVRITKAYWLVATITTQEQYERVMGTNPSHFLGDPKRPVENVSWYDAVEFCRRLSELPQERAAKRHYQLPTEAQWEYACRAGNGKVWFFSRHEGAASSPADRKLLGEFAWFWENSGESTHPVAKKKPNAWGLYDMYGNVDEWCDDWHAPYTNALAVDPTGRLSNVPQADSGWRVQRGGSFLTTDYWCRSALRDTGRPEWRCNWVGFRVCAVIAEPSQPDASGGK
jgi:formylglycine-generating enzyme required for sulfatase activity